MVYKVGMAANSLLKIGLLITLVLQTTSCVLLLRYSRHGATFDGSERYLISTTIVSSEIIKVLTSIIILYYQSSRNLKNLFILLRVELITKWEEAIKSAVPAVAYTLQNNLLFVALSHLDSVTYQVTYQLKIFVTAIFSVLMLNKKLSIFQWISLVMLIFGVVLIQLPDSFDVDNDNHARTNDLIGFVSVLISCFLSGFTGVYFEKILKKGQQSLWIRNFQLSLVSSILAALNAFTQDYDPIRKAGFFQGYSTLTWIVILIHAFGGFIVAGVMKYADNILKGFATSISIVLSTILSYYVMDDFQPQPYFWIGGPTVLMAVMLYSL